MADVTNVNGQITDAVTQANVTALGSQPAAMMANLSQVSAQTFGLMMQNAATAQQQLNMIAQATTTHCIALLARQLG
jgi:killing trait domain-containing protein